MTRFGDVSDTDYERAVIRCERDGGPIHEIEGGQMPIEGVVQNQHRYLADEVARTTSDLVLANGRIARLQLELYDAADENARLTRELHLARAEVVEARAETDRAERKLRESHDRWDNLAVRENADGELTTTL